MLQTCAEEFCAGVWPRSTLPSVRPLSSPYDPPNVAVRLKENGNLLCDVTLGLPSSSENVTFTQTVQNTLVRSNVFEKKTLQDSNNLLVKAEFNSSLYEDGGSYTCTAWNSVGSKSHIIEVATKSAPVIVPGFAAKFLIRNNDTGDLKVQFYSVPKFTSLKWAKDNDGNLTSAVMKVVKTKVLLKFHGVDVRVAGYEAALTFSTPNISDSGTYILTIDNDIGKARARVNVIVDDGAVLTTESRKTPAIKSSSSKVGIIAGTVCGILILIIALIIVAIVVFRWRGKNKKKSEEDTRDYVNVDNDVTLYETRPVTDRDSSLYYNTRTDEDIHTYQTTKGEYETTNRVSDGNSGRTYENIKESEYEENSYVNSTMAEMKAYEELKV